MLHHPSSNIEISGRMSFIPFSVWGMDNGKIKGRDCSKATCTDKHNFKWTYIFLKKLKYINILPLLGKPDF